MPLHPSPNVAQQLGHWLRARLNKVSLRQTFVLTVLIGLSLPGLIVTWINLDLRRDALTRQFHAEQRRALEILVLGLRQPLWDLSRLTAQPLIDSMLKDERIVSIQVDGNFSAEPFLSTRINKRQHGKLIRQSEQITYGEQVIGVVSVEFDDSHLRERLAAQVRENLMLIMAQLVASLLLILLVVDLRFLRPLKELAVQAFSLSSRNLNKPFRWLRGDEIGDLGRRLDTTRGELQRLFGELDQTNAELQHDIAERIRVEDALRSSEAKYRELFVSNLDGIFITDSQGLCLDANPALLSMLGIGPAQLIGHFVEEFIPSAWHAYDRHMVEQKVMVEGRCGEYEIELLRSDGSALPVSAKGVLMRNTEGQAIGIWRIVRDLTERKAAAVRMELASRVFDNTTEAIMVTDEYFHILSVNRAFTEMTGYRADEVVGMPTTVLRDPAHSEEAYDTVRRQFLTEGGWQGEQPIRRKDGSTFLAFSQANAVRDVTGKFVNMVSLIRDVSEIKAAQERILHLARFDALTGLPNRAYFRELVDDSLAAALRHEDRCALLFVDLDHFKIVNDSLGHAVGDALLQEVARRLCEAIRAGDSVGRLGGDEFVILLRRLDSSSDASFVANRVLERLSAHFNIADNELVVTPSVGIALYPDDGAEYDTLMRNADAAMYYAKENGRNNFQFYAASMNARAMEILSMESQLRRALEREEFVLHYQPQVEIHTGRVVGVEALIRWQHPERGMVPPNQFIPIAEERGLIGPLGNWVLKEACRQNKAWQDEGLAPITMAVNLSALQFYRQDLPDYIAKTLDGCQLEARYLEVEVTESIIMQDAESTVATMAALKAMGLKLAIDDFGTGYSSLSYLKRFKADKLKIDRSFVADVPSDADDSAITRAVISLARSLNLKVIAEGVESLEQWKFLHEEGCDEVQGYLVAKPMPAAEVGKLLQQGRWQVPQESQLTVE